MRDALLHAVLEHGEFLRLQVGHRLVVAIDHAHIDWHERRGDAEDGRLLGVLLRLLAVNAYGYQRDCRNRGNRKSVECRMGHWRRPQERPWRHQNTRRRHPDEERPPSLVCPTCALRDGTATNRKLEVSFSSE